MTDSPLTDSPMPVEAPWTLNRAPIELGRFSTTTLTHFFTDSKRPVVLWPMGSTEPHGPHLPLSTDVILAEENARRAAHVLRTRDVEAVVAPTLPFGVTDFARGFAGAISIAPDTLADLIVDGAACFLADGFKHVCIVNHHLEPAQIAALQAAHARIVEWHGPQAASFPQVISRRWGRQLPEEFQSGACHAGSYETSLVLAAAPRLVDSEAARGLPEVTVSLSDAIRAGKHTFMEAGADRAYTGRPADASADEGEATYRILTGMVVTEVLEALEMR